MEQNMSFQKHESERHGMFLPGKKQQTNKLNKNTPCFPV